MKKKYVFLSFLGILLLFLLLTFYYFSPLLPCFSSCLPGDYDEIFITWSINQISQKLPAWPKNLFQGNIFFPHPYSLAYSDPFIFSSLIAKPLIKLFQEPIIAFNINLVLAQFLTLFFSFLFLNQLVKDKAIAVSLAVVFSFSKIHLHYLPHLHTFAIYFLPLAGFLLLKFSQSQKPFWLYCWSAVFISQTLNSFLPGYFILFLTAWLYFSSSYLRKAVLKNLPHLLINIILIFSFTFPFINIYLKVSQHFNYVRPIKDVIHFSLSPEELTAKFFSPVLYLLFLISLVYFLIKKVQRKKSAWLLSLTIMAFILSLGPVLHWMKKTVKIPLPLPLPYLLFYFFAPGFKGFRTPSRWLVLAGFAAVAFVALEIKKMFAKKSGFKNLSLSFIFIFSLIFAPVPKNYSALPKINNYPPVYHWLKNQPGKVIIELPINAWGKTSASKQEVYRMLYSLLHQKTLVNGFSGYTPNNYYQLVSLFKKEFPSQKTILLLKKMKVDYLIVHQNEYQKVWGKETEKKLTQLGKIKTIKLIKKIGPDLVYQL